MVRIDGQLYDIPAAVRGFQRFTSEDRSNRAASFRLTQGQRESVGEAFWTHPLRPGVCFPTRIEALRAALATLTAEVPLMTPPATPPTEKTRVCECEHTARYHAMTAEEARVHRAQVGECLMYRCPCTHFEERPEYVR